MNDENGDGTARLLRRWGPIAAIAVIAIVVVVVLASSGGDGDGDGTAVGDDTSADDTVADDTAADDTVADDTAADDTATDDTTPAAMDPFEDDVVSWTEAGAAGIVDDIDWGERCDTERGTLAYPSNFAPDCYAPFEGDNGGATNQGVTEDEITIVWYSNPASDPIRDYILGPIANDDTPTEVYDTVVDLTEFYSTYFETYGRAINVVEYPATGGLTDSDAAIADAEAIARDIKPFMVWNAPTGTAFAEELAANGVMCMCLPGNAEFASDHHPYLHANAKSAQQSRLLLAEYIGKRLGGRNAAHSGDYQDQERVFGYLYIETSEQSTITANEFRDTLLDDWDVELVEMVPYELNPATIQEQAATRIARLKAAGVTSIIFAGDPVAPGFFTAEATAQDYFPEWVLAGSALVDTNAFARTYDQQQWEHAFGMSNTAARVAQEKQGLFFLYSWFFGEPPPAVDSVQVLVGPSVFLPVIQRVGPNLTPDTYMDTLLTGEPTARGALTQVSTSYGDQNGLWPDDMVPDYNGTDDVSEIWWDVDATGVDELSKEGEGMYTWVGGGQRYLLGEWPETDTKAFDPEGAVSFYDEIPESEAPPPYPSPANAPGG